jgi:hypothetical protein
MEETLKVKGLKKEAKEKGRSREEVYSEEF